jgi:hypothetical protein
MSGILATYGLPTRALVGAAGSDAAMLIVQHNWALQERVLDAARAVSSGTALSAGTRDAGGSGAGPPGETDSGTGLNSTWAPMESFVLLPPRICPVSNNGGPAPG